MLSITKKTGYGLIAMIHLAELAEGQLASAREISEEYGIPLAVLMNVLKQLSAEGYVRSIRGTRGGYCILKPPEEVNIAGLMEVLEGPMKLAECITGDGSGGDGVPACKLMPSCPIADPVRRLHRRIRDFLSGLSLADILYAKRNGTGERSDAKAGAL